MNLLRTVVFPYTTLFRSFWSAECTALGAAGEGEALRDCVVHHQPIPMITSKTIAPIKANLLPAGMTVRFLTSEDRKSTRLNSSHITISYAVFCLNKKRTR